MAMSMEHSESEGGKFTVHGYSMQDEDALIRISSNLADFVKPDQLVQVSFIPTELYKPVILDTGHKTGRQYDL